MKKYSKYKDSGIEWIGEVPEHWSFLKIGRSFSSIGSGTTPKSTNSAYYNEGNINWLNTGDLNDSYITETSKKITQTAVDEFSTLKEYSIDSIVIALYGATIGKLGHLKIPTTTNQACCVISGSDKIQQRFLFYYFLAARNYIISLSYGGGQPNISQDLIRQLYIPTPFGGEQNKIISFLDYKTTQIDTLIEKKEQLVEKLTLKRQAIINEAVTKGLNPDVPMKDSGIAWLGEVPEHWKVVSLKYLVSKVGSGVTPRGGSQVYQDSGIMLLRSQNIYSDGLRLDDVAFISNEIDEKMSNSRVKQNDVLLNITGASIGRCFYWNKEDDIANVNQHVCIIRPIEKHLTKYMHLLMVSKVGQTQIFLGQDGTSREGLNFEEIKSFALAIPPKGEIENIIDNVGSSTTQMDALIEKINTSIDKLKLYRQSLISEAVTGKIDLRDWEQTGNK